MGVSPQAICRNVSGIIAVGFGAASSVVGGAAVIDDTAVEPTCEGRRVEEDDDDGCGGCGCGGDDDSTLTEKLVDNCCLQAGLGPAEWFLEGKSSVIRGVSRSVECRRCAKGNQRKVIGVSSSVDA